MLLITGCLNNRFVLSAIYNRADNQIRKEFNKLGKWDDSQKKAFELRLQTFHYWHRRHEMPIYANLLHHISSHVADTDRTTLENTTDWMATVESAIGRVQSCYPAHFSVDLMRSLKPGQINYIERRFAREQRKNRARYESKTRDERMQERLKQVETWAGHFGFWLTKRQKRMLLRTMYNTRSLYNEYYQAIVPWNKQLFTIARKNKDIGFESEIREHMTSLYDLLETRHPETFAFNRKLWREFLLEFEQSLTWDQREWLKPFLNKLASNIDKLAKSDVSFEPHGDASLGCLPTTTALAQ